MALLEEEPTVSLPKLTPGEHAKGIAIAAYACTASRVKDMGDEAGVSEPVAAAASSVRGALTSLTRGFTGVNDEPAEASAPVRAGGPAPSVPLSQTPTGNLDDFLEAPLLPHEGGASAAGHGPA